MMNALAKNDTHDLDGTEDRAEDSIYRDYGQPITPISKRAGSGKLVRLA